MLIQDILPQEQLAQLRQLHSNTLGLPKPKRQLKRIKVQ